MGLKTAYYLIFIVVFCDAKIQNILLWRYSCSTCLYIAFGEKMYCIMPRSSR